MHHFPSAYEAVYKATHPSPSSSSCASPNRQAAMEELHELLSWKGDWLGSRVELGVREISIQHPRHTRRVPCVQSVEGK